MASWMIHLRIADILLDHFDVTPTEFIVGNLAPDSGVPNEDWSAFTPDTAVSHYKTRNDAGKKFVNTEKFISEYFSREKRSTYSKEEFSFFLGYLSHLYTDIIWVSDILELCKKNDEENYNADPVGTVWKWKRDFYDLDAKYLRDNPDFRAFAIYQNAVGFKNAFMDIFAPDAFDNRREYITNFYLAKREDLDREYVYLTESSADEFVSRSSKRITDLLRQTIEDC